MSKPMGDQAVDGKSWGGMGQPVKGGSATVRRLWHGV